MVFVCIQTLLLQPCLLHTGSVFSFVYLLSVILYQFKLFEMPLVSFHLNIAIWKFPEIGVPQNLLNWDFPLKTIHFRDPPFISIYGNHHIPLWSRCLLTPHTSDILIALWLYLHLSNLLLDALGSSSSFRATFGDARVCTWHRKSVGICWVFCLNLLYRDSCRCLMFSYAWMNLLGNWIHSEIDTNQRANLLGNRRWFLQWLSGGPMGLLISESGKNFVADLRY